MAFKTKAHTVLVLQNMYSDWPNIFRYNIINCLKVLVEDLFINSTPDVTLLRIT